LARARVCVAVQAPTVDGLLERAHRAEAAGADLVEARLDGLRELEGFEPIPKLVSVPVIATLRVAGEGGSYKGVEERRLEVFRRAASSGYSYVDVELRSGILDEVAADARAKGCGVIASWHDFTGTPPPGELEALVAGARRKPWDVLKVVTTARSGLDNLVLLRLLARHRGEFEMVCFAMGEIGLPSRVLSPIFGATFTIASLAQGEETAPGQLPLEEARDMLRELGAG